MHMCGGRCCIVGERTDTTHIEHEGDFCSNGAVSGQPRQQEAQQVQIVADEGISDLTIIVQNLRQWISITVDDSTQYWWFLSAHHASH